jgi:hypothetical protein
MALSSTPTAWLTDGASGLDFKNPGAGTCTSGTYTASESCTVSVVFSPTAPGLRRGALILQDSSGNLLGTEYMYGIGIAPEIAYDTAQPLSHAIQVGGSLLNAPESIAIDGNGNVFIADPGLNQILRVPTTDLTRNAYRLHGSELPYQPRQPRHWSVWDSDRWRRKCLYLDLFA